jgi:tight adherence protein B
MLPAGPMPVALLVALAVLLFFVALWRRYGAKDLIDSRLGEYGQVTDPLSNTRQAPTSLKDRLGRSIRRMTWAEGLANSLRQADVPYTAVEYALIMLGLSAAGFLLGTARAGLVLGIPLGISGLYGPVLYLKSKGTKRRQTIADQLPDVLTLLVGALRAGYGLSQALNVVADQAPQPSRDEYVRALQAVELGVPLQQAMTDMADRIDSDDVDLFVSVVNIQFELGGNLAQTLDTIGETIRDRIRLQREIRVQTSQQQLSGYVLVGLPVFLGVAISFISPGFMEPLFEPGLPRLMLIGMVIMEIMGYLIIRKILDLDV